MRITQRVKRMRTHCSHAHGAHQASLEVNGGNAVRPLAGEISINGAVAADAHPGGGRPPCRKGRLFVPWPAPSGTGGRDGRRRLRYPPCGADCRRWGGVLGTSGTTAKGTNQKATAELAHFCRSPYCGPPVPTRIRIRRWLRKSCRNRPALSSPLRGTRFRQKWPVPIPMRRYARAGCCPAGPNSAFGLGQVAGRRPGVWIFLLAGVAARD